jgi:hypothetical protein
MPEGDFAVLFLENSLEIPAGWQLLRDGTLVQMVCSTVPDRPSLTEAILPMTSTDFPEMVTLASLTKPGPFRNRTATLGGFVGFASMAASPQWLANDWPRPASRK